MTTEQQRKMLECAAKACGLTYLMTGEVCDLEQGNYHWNPLTNPADTAEMCAETGIDTCFCLELSRVTCDGYSDNDYILVIAEFKDHDNSRLKAWMYAATMVAAKIGGI